MASGTACSGDIGDGSRFDAMLQTLAVMAERNITADMIDSTMVPAHPLCSRHKRGLRETEAHGRSRGGFSTKLHARCDAKGPLVFVPTLGQAHNIQNFGPLIRMISDKIEALLTDKGYDTDGIREKLANAEVEAVIPAKSNRRGSILNDRTKYRWRNLVERLFNKLKNWRRIATRNDKTKESYLGFVALASIKLWLAFVHEASHQNSRVPSRVPVPAS